MFWTCCRQDMDKSRIVITGIGLAAPGADTLAAFRTNLLAGKSGVSTVELRYMGLHPAGICSFDETRYRLSLIHI